MSATDSGTFDVPKTLSFLNYLADRFSRKIAHFVCLELRGDMRGADLIDQNGSPLGRKHNEAVRARIARGEPGADIVGRRHLLTRQALREELARQTSRNTSAARTVDDDDPVADLDRELASLRGER